MVFIKANSDNIFMVILFVKDIRFNIAEVRGAEASRWVM